MSDDRADVDIRSSAIAERLKRPRLRFSLLALLMFVCCAGATIGTLGTMLLRTHSQSQVRNADLAALQGVWDLQGNLPTLVIRGERYTSLPDSSLHGPVDGTIKIDVTGSSRTIDFLGRPFGSDAWSRTTFSYSIDGDTLTLRPISTSPTYGPASEIDGDAKALIAKRVSAPPLGKGNRNGTPRQ